MALRFALGLVLLQGCFVHVTGVGSSDDGGVYLAARRSFLGVPGKLRIMSCESGVSDLSCRRVLDGPQLQRQMSVAGRDGSGAASRAAGDPSTRASYEIDEPDSVTDTRVTPVQVNPTEAVLVLAEIYKALGRPTPDDDTWARDQSAVTAILRRGYTRERILALIPEAVAATPEGSVTTLLMYVVRKGVP